MFTVKVQTQDNTGRGYRLTGRFTQRAKALSRNVLRAERASAAAMKAQAIRLSSGTISTRELQKEARRRGHGLYSTADPAPPQDPAILNAQSGQIRRGWVAKVYVIGDGTRVTLYNVSRHSRFMLGTRKMIARPIVQKVIELEREARTMRLLNAKRSALKL